MVYAAAFAGVALATLLRVEAATTLRGSPTDMIELQAVDGGVYVRDTLAVYGEPGTPTVDCELGDWEPESECNAGTLTQIFVRKATIAPGGDGAAACEDVRETRKCKPVHCEMGPWTLWSDCEEGGYKTRTREKLQDPLYGGRSCPHEIDRVKCRPEDCLVCGWSDWKCDPKTEKKTRTRIVTRKPQLTGKKCPRLEDEADCDPIDCVLDDAYEDEWTECDAKGDRHKYRKIKVPAQYKGAKACPPPEDVWMTDKGACPPVDCEEVDESTVAFGECEEKGYTNTWFRKKVIGIKTYPKYGGIQCRSESERTVEQLCDPVPCVMDEWQFEGECMKNGKRKRVRKVKTQAMFGAPQCIDQEDEHPDPESCPPVDCEEVDASTVSFGECQEEGSSNTWFRKKVIGIKTRPKYGGKRCRSKHERTVVELCDPVPCVMDEWQFEGECKIDGKRKRTKRVLVQAKYGATECTDQVDEQLDPEYCPPVDCKEEAESSCRFGACERKEGTPNTWSKKKVIGIETYPMYGGKECRSETERTVEEVCDPVPCVMDEWQFEGECKEDGRRKRTKRVLVQALYGAEECTDQEDEQPDPESCPPVACEEEDEANVRFGECEKKDGPTPTWTKKKVLSIKTFPRYGGTQCRSETERTVEEVCDPVSCVMDEWQSEGECKIDGKRKRTRKVKTQAMYGAEECSDQEDEQLDPEYCPPVDCKEEAESTCRFGECEKKEDPPNTWSKKKVIGIETYPMYGGKECRSESERTVEEVCDPVPCVMGAWQFEGECKANGKRKRTRKVEVQALYGAEECSDQEDEKKDTEGCPPVDCEEDDASTVEFGECEYRRSAKKWYRKKVITIKTEPMYGGVACRSLKERTVEECCTPVPCVMSDWKFVGPCDNDGKRKKTRGVLSQGMYGAPECTPEEKSERDPVECPATDCVLGYGWTNWGSCINGKKKRTSKINVPAKYGGACFVEEDFSSCR